MSATITQAAVQVFHNPTSNTGGCSVAVAFTVTTLSGESQTIGPVVYSQDDLGLTANQENTLDTIITAIKNAAVAKAKADMGALTLAPGV